MRRGLASVIGVSLLLSITGCAGETAGTADSNEVVTPTESTKTGNIPATSDDFAGKNYKEVVDDLEAAGFTGVETSVIPDLITGWLTKDGEVENVEVDGKSDFKAGDSFPSDAEVVVSYHTFPEDEPSESAEPTQSPSPDAEPTETETEPAEPAEPAILNPQNNPELAAMLKVEPCDGPDIEFSKKYAEKTIAFNGSVAAMGPHGNYETRYDILIAPGNMGSSSVSGPTFQFRDVNFSDLNLTGKVADSFGVDDKARFIAKVGLFDKNSCIFVLRPVETQVR